MLSLEATEFRRFMDSGRTAPAIFGCVDASGLAAGDFVVKLRGGIETAGAGLLREFVGAKLASHFEISMPEPALVWIEEALAQLVSQAQPAHERRMLGSVGLNFGTRELTGGYSTWPVGKPIPESMFQAATDVFAFDALIQNPDRRSSNPNLLSRGDRLAVFDHEMAFSFLLDIIPSAQPWILANQRYLAEHVFYQQLRSKALDLEGFITLLRALSAEAIRGILSDVPPEWTDTNVSRIEQHLNSIRENAVLFSEEIRRFLI